MSTRDGEHIFDLIHSVRRPGTLTYPCFQLIFDTVLAMAKGSQLSQLKAALNQAGLSHPQQNGKKRKRATPDEKEKEKKATKLKEIHQKLNPFDIKVTKLKHDVGGRKVIGTVGRPAQSKQAGMEQVRIHSSACTRHLTL